MQKLSTISTFPVKSYDLRSSGTYNLTVSGRLIINLGVGLENIFYVFQLLKLKFVLWF